MALALVHLFIALAHNYVESHANVEVILQEG